MESNQATPITPSTPNEFMGMVRRHNERLFSLAGKTPAAFVRTFGCQQNVSDSEKLQGMLAEMGYALVDGPETADLILFNTCAVRENAEERVFGNVGMLKAAKEQNRNLVIGLCGCMMQQEHMADYIREHYPYVDLVFGTHAITRLPELLWRKIQVGGRVVDTRGGDEAIPEDIPLRREGKVKAWVPIMYGCNNFCTYCVVPFVRGRERSREAPAILEEIAGLVAQGYREITLLGQNVNSYGKTLEPKVSFAQLLQKINALPGDFIIRFMTSHPKDCTHELIDAIADCEKVERHIHLPVQSGSDRILKAMNRRYTAEQYRELVRYARQKIPGVAFTGDILVGFPGETQEDFEETYQLVGEIGYHSLFTFLYSRREGTKAAQMEDTASREEKSARFGRLLELQREMGMGQHRQLIGKTLRVLAEGPGKTGEGRLAGRSSQGVIVEFDGDEALVGSFVNVRVTDALLWAVIGTQIQKNTTTEETKMDVIQTARELGKAIQQDGRYIALRTAQQHNDEDEALQKMIASFNSFRGELTAEMQSPDRDQQKIQEMDAQLKDMYAKIFENEHMIAFTNARSEMQTLVNFINQIVLGSTEGQDPDLIEYEESCGGDCGGCSGCS